MSKTLEIKRCIIYGVAVGDALGFPYQFIKREVRIRFPVIDMGITIDDMGNKYYLPEAEIGLWSDDTSLTLCLVESLGKGYDLLEIAERFLLWLNSGYLSALDAAFDQGIQTEKALRELEYIIRSGKLKLLAQRIEKPDIHANGNGALMRILPLATYIYPLPLEKQFRIVTEVSALTHPHIRSVLCCFLYLRIAIKIIDKKSLPEAITDSQEELREFIADRNILPEDLKALHRLLIGNLYLGSIKPNDRFSIDYINSGGYVVHTLEAVMWCLLNGSSFKETVLKAVNLGDDTDTVAAIAGGLAALYYGFDSIPETWIKCLKKRELIELIVENIQRQ